MRLFQVASVESGTSLTLTWNTDQLSTAVIQYGPLRDVPTALDVDTAAYQHSASITSLTPGVTYQWRIMAIRDVNAGMTSAFVTSPWQRYTAFTAVTPTTVSPAREVAPLNSYAGDRLAATFPSWMSLARIPGATVLTDVETTVGEPYLYTVVDDLTVGMLCSVVGTTTPYTISAIPGQLTLSVTNLAASGALTTTLPTTLGNTEIGSTGSFVGESATYTVTAISVVDDLLTIEPAPDNAHTSAQFILNCPVVTLDRAITVEASDWVALPVGRVLFEAMSNATETVENFLQRTAAPYSPSQQDVDQAWRGHVVPWRGWDPTTPSSALTIARLNVPSMNRSALPLVQVTTPYDLMTATGPVCLAIDGVVLLNHLTMVEEECLGVVDGTTIFTLSQPCLPGSTILYMQAPIDPYGWQPLDYTLVDSTHIEVLGEVENPSWLLRYELAHATTPYNPTAITLNVDGRTETPTAHPLWNRFDELGLLLGVTRRWEEPSGEWYHEPNTTYQERLHAAAILEPAPTRNEALARIALHLGLLTRVEWDPDTEASKVLTNATAIVIPEWEQQTATYLQSLVRGPSTGPHRYYVTSPILGDPYLFCDGRLDDRPLRAECEEEVVVTEDTSYSFTTTDAPIDGASLYYRTRARDWSVLWADDITFDGTTLELPLEERFAHLITEGPITVRYGHTVGGALPVSFVEATDEEWTRHAVFTTTYRSPNWIFDTMTSTLHALQPHGSPVEVFCVMGPTLTSPVDPSYRYDLDDPLIDRTSGLATDKYLKLASELRAWLPIFVGQARWDDAYWFAHDGTDPGATRLMSPWTVVA